VFVSKAAAYPKQAPFSGSTRVSVCPTHKPQTKGEKLSRDKNPYLIIKIKKGQTLAYYE